LSRRGVVHQQEAPLLILNGDAAGKHPDYVSQDSQLAVGGEVACVHHSGNLQIEFVAALHNRRPCQTLL
jgi:hypothetical protein